MDYIAHIMGDMRHMMLRVGRALAVLAAIVVAIVPALPAHAHMHPTDAVLVHGALDHDGQSDETGGGLPAHTGDCCLINHVPVIPTALAVPLPATVMHAPFRALDRDAPPDAASEALPEPPRLAA